MSRLNLIVNYPMDTEIPVITSDIKPEHWAEVLEAFITDQTGRGNDGTPRVDRMCYRIHVQLDLTDDSFYSEHDCGNDALMCGLMMATLDKIRDGKAVANKETLA